MTNLPRTLVERAAPLPMAELTAHMPVAAEAVANLEAQNFAIRSGLTEDLIGGFAAIAQQPHIGGPYPEDRRMWADKDSVATALGRGMAAFVLLAPHPEKPKTNLRYVAGYGWLQNRPAGNINGGHTQFAIRIREVWRGQQLSADFGRAILGAAKVSHDVDRVWAEFWRDDDPAARLAYGLGFDLRAWTEQERSGVHGRFMDQKLKVVADINTVLKR